MVKAILFDLGDTLFDSKRMERHAVFEQAGRQTYAYLQSLGCTLPTYKRYFRMQALAVYSSYAWSVITRREFNTYHLLVKLSRKMKLQLEDHHLRDLAWRWYSPMPQYTTVADDVIPTLTKLRARGYKLALVSNTCIPGFVLDKHLDLHNLREFFPVRIYSSEFGVPKPNAKIFHEALNVLGVNASESIFVGDRVKTDIIGARGVGMRTVLRQIPTRWEDPGAADFVIRKISDLRQILPQVSSAAEPVDLPGVDELAYEG
jgi:HAD superfamily hydrolase (TIGR01509 family)